MPRVGRFSMNNWAGLQLTRTGVNASFAYDGDGNRVLATVGGVTTVYLGNYYERDMTAGVPKRYYYAGGLRVGVRTGTTTLNYLFGDHLGSTSITANSSGGFVSEVRYMPFGQERYTSGATPTTYRFTGQRQESGLGGPGGLYFYGARWYDSLTGRFASADTIVLRPFNPQSLNRYSYVLNSPLRYTDPTGHYECANWDASGRCTAREPRPKRTGPPKTPPVGAIPDSGGLALAGLLILYPVAGNTISLVAYVVGTEYSGNTSSATHEGVTARYRNFCGAGAYTAACLNNFWGYMQAILHPVVDNLRQYMNRPQWTDYVSVARGIMDGSLNPEWTSCANAGCHFGLITEAANSLREGDPSGSISYYAYVARILHEGPADEQAKRRDTTSDGISLLLTDQQLAYQLSHGCGGLGQPTCPGRIIDRTWWPWDD